VWYGRLYIHFTFQLCILHIVLALCIVCTSGNEQSAERTSTNRIMKLGINKSERGKIESYYESLDYCMVAMELLFCTIRINLIISFST